MNKQYGLSNTAPLLQVRRLTCAEGRGKGVDLFRVVNGAGLDFDVLIDRCMAIGDLRIDGKMVSYAAEPGVVHPAYYDSNGTQWLRSFGGGFLATCGLNQVGEPCFIDGENIGLHGRVDNIPAMEVGSHIFEKEDVLYAEITGTVVQAMHQGEYFVLRRTIGVCHAKCSIWLRDEITNLSENTQPFMLLYHINFGLPFLKEGSQVNLPATDTTLWMGDFSDWKTIQQEQKQDSLWLHQIDADESNRGHIEVSNGEKSVHIFYPTDTLPVLAQWRLCGPCNSVLAIEPTNTHLLGRQWESENGTLEQLKPGENRTIELEFCFL